MCGPQTAMAAQGAGTVAQSVGAYYAARAQKTALKGQAALDDINARLADISGHQALRSGAREEQKSKLYASRVKQGQEVAYRANGVDIGGSESAINVISTTDVLSEIDANAIKANAFREAWGYRTEATNWRNSAIGNRAAASAINPWMAAATTALTGASDIAKNRYLMTKYGEKK